MQCLGQDSLPEPFADDQNTNDTVGDAINKRVEALHHGIVHDVSRLCNDAAVSVFLASTLGLTARLGPLEDEDRGSEVDDVVGGKRHGLPTRKASPRKRVPLALSRSSSRDLLSNMKHSVSAGHELCSMRIWPPQIARSAFLQPRAAG